MHMYEMAAQHILCNWNDIFLFQNYLKGGRKAVSYRGDGLGQYWLLILDLV